MRTYQELTNSPCFNRRGTELIELCNKINNFTLIAAKLDVLNPPDQGSLDDLVKWKNDMDQSVQATSDNEYDKPLSDLLTYLSDQLPQP